VKFFTKELWLSGQQPENLERYSRDWQKVYEEYRAQLEKLQPRLANDVYNFFAEADVHDGELIDLSVSDGRKASPILSENKTPWAELKNYPVAVTMEVLDSYEKLIWRLSYKKVRRVVVDFPTLEPLFYGPGEGFGDWGYHELSDAGNDFFRHEVLFATGASLLFEFKEIAVSFSARQLLTPQSGHNAP
jgi:hypothetical protein